MKFKNQGLLLLACRQKLNLNQSVVAKKLGFTAQFLGRIESGAVQLPKDKYKKACEILSIKKDTLKGAALYDYEQMLRGWLA